MWCRLKGIFHEEVGIFHEAKMLKGNSGRPKVRKRRGILFSYLKSSIGASL